jgi:hypothetical protein
MLNTVVTIVAIVVIGLTIIISAMTFLSIPFSSYASFLYYWIGLLLFYIVLTKEDKPFI